MIKTIENRNGYQTAVYTLEVTSAMKQRCLDFAREIILGGNQYLRLSPIEIQTAEDIQLSQKVDIQRTYAGKLGELVFLNFLHEKGIFPSTDGMFDIYEGKTNVDNYDFYTQKKQTVDIKTGFRSNHVRLLINTQQFDNIPKDFYVAVKLNASDTDISHKLIDWDSITEGMIMGYADYHYINRSAKIKDYGEGPARSIFYQRLLGIDKLIRDQF